MDWIVPVSPAERDAGRLSPATAADAYASMHGYGCVILRGALETAQVDALHADYQAQWGHAGAEDMAARAAAPPTPLLCVGEGRYEILVKVKGAFGDPALFGNPLLTTFLLPMLGDQMQLSSMTVVTSFPGSQQQHTHRDHALLFGEPGVSGALPPHAINVSIPLIDVDETIGATGVWPGSHRWNIDRKSRPEEMHVSPFQRGDCVLMDYRTLHAGLPNRSGVARPILYLVYARHWFFDEANHRARPSLDMDADAFAALPPHLQSLMMRAKAERLRALYLAGETPG